MTTAAAETCEPESLPLKGNLGGATAKHQWTCELEVSVLAFRKSPQELTNALLSCPILRHLRKNLACKNGINAFIFVPRRMLRPTLDHLEKEGVRLRDRQVQMDELKPRHVIVWSEASRFVRRAVERAQIPSRCKVKEAHCDIFKVVLPMDCISEFARELDPIVFGTGQPCQHDH